MIEYTVKVYPDGDKEWYLNGVALTKEEHKRRTANLWVMKRAKAVR